MARACVCVRVRVCVCVCVFVRVSFLVERAIPSCILELALIQDRGKKEELKRIVPAGANLRTRTSLY